MARERTYTCSDCPDGKQHVTTSAGPLPSRCPAHKRTRKAATNRDGKDRRAREAAKVRLHVVPEPADPTTPAPGDPPPVAAPAPSPGPFPPGASSGPPSVLGALRDDLAEVFSTHPAAGTLRSVAEVLADVLDSPIAQADGRIAATVAKELRSVVHELTSAKAEEDDPLFATSVGPSVVGG